VISRKLGLDDLPPIVAITVDLYSEKIAGFL
jgi:hypothetical protein